MNEPKYNHLEEVIKARASEIAKHLDEMATHVGKHSWLIVPESSRNKMCLVAHIDTVFENRFEAKTILKNDNVWSSPQGICGDDRCGVYALLQLYRKLPEESRPILLFTDGEECGGIGAKEACGLFAEQLKDVTYFLELDRKGADDMVFYNREPEEFRDHIGQYGFVDRNGSFSDITVLGRAFNKCSVNLSIGYYNQHTLQETINYDEMVRIMNVVYDICVDETGRNMIWENEWAA